MKTRVFLLLIIILGLALPAHAQRTLIHCGTVLDPGVSMEPMNDRTIIVDGARITAVDDGFTRAGSGDTVVNLRDAYCMPGLMDMHVHLTGESRKNGYIDRFTKTPLDAVLASTRYARRTLMAGFTTVRDVGSTEGTGYALRDAIRHGHVVGPRMFVAGQSLAITGGHGDPTNGGREDLLGIPTESQGVVDGVDSATRAARLAFKRGSDLIKITATGGVLSVARDGSAAQFFEDEIRAIVAVASGFGIKVTAHAHGDEGMQRAIRAGVKSIEHGTYMSAETMEMMKDYEVYYVPTITAGRSVADSAQIANYYVPLVAEKALRIGPVIQDTFGKAYQAGVPIAFGTDAGVFKHGENALEFQYMVEAGMPPMETIRSATYASADLLDHLDHLGTLEPGKFADLVAVPRNPLDDISVLYDAIDFVMQNGIVYKQAGQPTAHAVGGM